MLRFLLLLFAAGIVVGAGREYTAPRQAEFKFEFGTDDLIVDSAALVYLETIAETTHVETARCIPGGQENDSTFALYPPFETPWLENNADSTGLTFYWHRCPRPTVAWWHAHPWRVVKKWAMEQNVSPQNWCTPSVTDVEFQKPFPFMLISVRRGITCIYYLNPVDGKHYLVPMVR